MWYILFRTVGITVVFDPCRWQAISLFAILLCWWHCSAMLFVGSKLNLNGKTRCEEYHESYALSQSNI